MPLLPPALHPAANWRPDQGWQFLRQAMTWPDPFHGMHLVRTSLLILGLLLLLLGLLWLWRWQKTHDLRSMPIVIFAQLAWRLGLPLRQQWLLLRIARHQQLPSALTLLLADGTLAYHGLAYADSLPPHRRLVVLARVTELRQQLFGAQITEPG